VTADGFFDPHQRNTVAAAMARIIPTDDQPGAREAGTIDFLDRYLSGLDHISAKPDGSGFEKLDGWRAQAWQQRLDILRDKYATGVQELDRRGNARFGADYADLTGEQQDQVLTELEKGSRQAFYADPIYGGNRNRVGWDLIGFPGPASLADVHSGRYSVVEYFADPLGYPGKEDDRGA
jgi:gluconate 2-dehydrogenase gamma chain